MCCCTCGMSVLMKKAFPLLKKACPGNGCITWFILSMLFTIVVFGLFIAFQVNVDNGDGSFPTKDYQNFTGFLIAGNFFSFFACLTCLILIFLNKKSLVLSILCEAALIFGFMVTLYCIYYLSYEKPSVRVSKYTIEFYRQRKEAPAFMNYVQRKARVSIPIPGNKPELLGCCGSESFFDYSISSRRLNSNGTDFLFDAPDSCCKMQMEGKVVKGCGKNLMYGFHFQELGFLNEAIKLATGGRNKNLTILQSVDKILAQHMADLEKIKREAEAEMKKPKPEPRFILSIAESLTHLFDKDQIENLKQLPDLAEAIRKRSKLLAEFQAGRRKNVKIHVIGCGRVFDAVCSVCVTVFVSIQAVVNGITILVYIWYYVRLGSPVPGI